MPNTRKPLEEGEFSTIKEETKKKYIKIGLLYFVQNWNYKDIQDAGYGSEPTIASALRYFRHYFDDPNTDESLIGAIVSVRERLKWMKQDVVKIRKMLGEEVLKTLEKVAYYRTIVTLISQITTNEELLYKLQGVLKGKLDIDITEKFEDSLSEEQQQKIIEELKRAGIKLTTEYTDGGEKEDDKKISD